MFFLAFVLSPEMLDLFQGKGNVRVRNVVPEREFFPGIYKEQKSAPIQNNIMNTMKSTIGFYSHLRPVNIHIMCLRLNQ